MTTNSKKSDGLQGEGNYDAARDYNKATKAFAESGKVDSAARDAAPDTEREKQQLEQAEAAGKARIAEKEPVKGAKP